MKQRPYSTTIAHATTSNGCTFASVKADTSIGAMAKLFLQLMAMLPDLELTGAGIAANYNADNFFITNAQDRRYLTRGGSWEHGVGAGVFHSDLRSGRSYSYARTGGRSALID